jgi:hypothetical protein
MSDMNNWADKMEHDLAHANERARDAEHKAQQLQAELDALKAAHTWIKTSERMPDPEVVVLVVSTQDYIEGEVCTAKCYMSPSGLVWEHFSGETGEAGMDIESACVTHWQPLPEPPK